MANEIVRTERIIRNLALVGFMGSGKSTIGRLAAEQLRFDFIDTDHLIESRTGVSISDIFARHGEAVFRGFERDVVLELESARNLVISTGGGLVLNPDNVTSLKRHALVICLWAAPEDIFERVRGHSHRPLLQTPDPLGKIRDLLAVREPFYKQADVLIHTGARSVTEVLQQVLHQFEVSRHRDT